MKVFELIGEHKVLASILAVLLLGAVIYRLTVETSPATASREAQDPKAATTQSAVRSNSGSVYYRKRAKEKSTERLPAVNEKRKVEMILKTCGKGESANWGRKGICSFDLTYYVNCMTEILEKQEMPGGEIRVTEKRTYSQCRQVLQVSECDVRLDLFATLPLKDTLDATKAIGAGLASLGFMSTGTSMAGGAAVVERVAKWADGKSVRDVLSGYGVNLSAELEKHVNEFIARKITAGDRFRVEKLEGKSYLVHYYQDKDGGVPLRVHFTYADGSELPSDSEEMLVLRRANAFIDSEVVPDDVRSSQPGKIWSFDASEIECVMDPFVKGSYSGKIEVVRKENDNDGDWVLEVKPSNVFVEDDGRQAGKTTGEITLNDGMAKVDEAKAMLKKLSVRGTCNLSELTPHHMLFKSQIKGKCSFFGTVETTTLK